MSVCSVLWYPSRDKPTWRFLFFGVFGKSACRHSIISCREIFSCRLHWSMLLKTLPMERTENCLTRPSTYAER